DHVGVPLQEGLLLVHNTLVGIGVRDRVKLGASGKIITAFDIARTLAIGAGGSLSATTPVILTGAGATFDLSGATTPQTTGTLSGVAGSTVNLGGNALTLGGSANGTFGGTIAGTGGSLTLSGTGTETLNGTN
ncbi:glutamate synthase-related protein, partial [Bacillus velezensis]|nr:glutamate synthase-related protein [Bacillus velezensis]